ncbi:MAG: glycosyltransferase family 4 protein [Candidatus Jordarchaeaceae archaeon]
MDFYIHLVRSLKEYCAEEILIAYVNGEIRYEWSREFSFDRIKISSTRKSKSLEFFSSRKIIYEQVKKMNVDAIFVLSELWTLEFSSYVSRMLNIPFVVWVRGDHRRVREARRINWFKRILANYFETKYLNQASFVIPNCIGLFEKLKRWGVEKSKITKPVYNGVDTDLFRPMNIPRSDKFTVAYAGRICPEKRVAEFLEIAKDLKDIKFIMAGSRDMEIKIPENVEYLGKIPFEQMPKFYNMADIVVLPSLTEGFPSVILEAYACEKPILVTEEAFPKELKLFGSIVNLNDLGQKIRELQNTDLKNIGMEARNYVKENFSWKQYGESIKAYLEKAIHREEYS